MREDVIEPYKLFVDLDGVLVDFYNHAQQLFPHIDIKAARERNPEKKMFWKAVKQHIDSGEPFWGGMPPMPDAMVLWNHVKQFHPTILTATGYTAKDVSAREKQEWVRQHLGPNVPIILVEEAKHKSEYAAPNHILIDDQNKAIGPWVEKGGVGILHTSAAHTIEELKKLGL